MAETMHLLHVDDVVRWAFLTGVELMQAGRASLLLRFAGESILVPVASVGIDRETVQAIQVRVGEGVAGVVADRGAHFFGSAGETTFICMPVRTDRGVEGVLCLTNRLGDQQFGGEHIPQAQALAGHIANALDYSRKSGVDRAPEIPNLHTFEDMLERELARSKRVGRRFAVAALAVEVRRPVPGDSRDLQHAVATALQNALRRYDYAAYLGDQIYGLIFALPYEGGQGLLQRISQAVHVAAEEAGTQADVHLGVARCPEDGAELTSLLSVARRRLAEAMPAYQVLPG